jgi:DNA modification methylase
MREHRATSTSNFGVGRRESHDASAFYRRFRPPAVSDADDVLPPKPVAEPFICGDARSMPEVADGSVALVVTSPPYFAGKQYEEELEREGVPGSYLEYLQLLTDVFAECVRSLEPGGRIAVNVANLGRKPYRSLSADVVRILQDELGLLLRGEVVWQKGEGATGSCAWGSFRSASNPVLRDLTERVIVASKGRFDRARSVAQRRAEGLPHRSTLATDDFLALTLDLWSIPAESARRVGHPAPFPVELPAQVIRLYTFVDDLVLDPFMGSGSTLVAASSLGRRCVGYDLDPGFVELARRRVAEVEDELVAAGLRDDDGRAAVDLAADALEAAGFKITRRAVRIPDAGLTVTFAASDASGRQWLFDVAGANTSPRGGLTRTETVWKALGRASAASGRVGPEVPFVVITTDLPGRRSEGDRALRAAGPAVVFDVVDVRSMTDRDRLAQYAATGPADGPQPGFWSADDITRRRR